MADRSASAAAALFPHLPHQSDVVAQQDRKATVAEAMYPALSPQPQAPPDWREYYLRLVGLRKIDQTNKTAT